MPSTRRSAGSSPSDESTPKKVLQPVNVVTNKSLIGTPSKQVKALRTELENKDAENAKLREDLAKLTQALSGLDIVKGKIAESSNAIENQEKNKKTKKKDADAPVPAKTAYRFFSDAYKAANPDCDSKTTDLQKLWKETTGEKRDVFVSLAEADKKRFVIEMREYAPKLAAKQEEEFALEMYYEKKRQDVAEELLNAYIEAQNALNDTGKGKKNKKAKDPDAPKRPTSNYMYFATEKRESVKKTNPSASPTEITKILGEMWNNLEKGKKGKNGTKKYDDLAEKDRSRYESEKAAYDKVVAKRNLEAEQEREERMKREKEEALELMASFKRASDFVTSES